ncbi:MAG: hypothetical protein JWP20_639 [Roseomonas sp.]|nr:hypothetical protein [Roseomonas sp.]
MAPRQVLTQEVAARFATIALGHVRREYPNKPDHLLENDADARTPRALHPVFYGSLDWHSCVHSYWMLARLLRRFPGMEPAADIRALLAAQLTPEKIEAECAYFRRPSARGFKRPYGWGWLLKLAEELSHHPGHEAAAALAPLAGIVVRRFRDFLPQATYPVRVGTHFNTAFALSLAADYATAAGDDGLLALLREKALAWYGADADCQAWEPGGDDFLSSALVEAECMRRLLPIADFTPWFRCFLPRLQQRQPAALFQPVTVTDRSDGKIAHLDGLNLSRAWCWRSLSGTLPEARDVMLAAADAHLEAGLPHVAGDYMGEHWLATFAVLALEA